MATISLTWQEANNIEMMTNMYLYGQKTKPSLIDPSLIRDKITPQRMNLHF